jgi:hypothetical protein
MISNYLLRRQGKPPAAVGVVAFIYARFDVEFIESTPRSPQWLSPATYKK